MLDRNTTPVLKIQLQTRLFTVERSVGSSLRLRSPQALACHPELPHIITYPGSELTAIGLVVRRFHTYKPGVFSRNRLLGSIEQTIPRTARGIAYKATPYIIEVIESHSWNGSRTIMDSQSRCLVHPYADSWDNLPEPWKTRMRTRPSASLETSSRVL